MARRPKSVWFFVVPRTSLIDLAGPWDVLGTANDVLGRVAYELEVLGPTAPVVPTRFGLTVGRLKPLPKRPTHLPDVGIVAGAPRNALPGEQEPLVRWLRQHEARIPTIVSICAGAFVLGAAGILDGHRATTHWELVDELRARYPNVRVVDEGIYVRDGRIWTSAGLTAGIDLTLALVEADHGHQVAMTVAKRMVLFLRRSGNQAQFSSALRRQQQGPPGLRDVSTFVLEHLDHALSVEHLARSIGMSPRTLSRWCREHLDESPAELVRRCRLDEARRLLEETALPLKDIATRTGLGDTSTLWRVFTRQLGVTPAAYRERFAASA